MRASPCIRAGVYVKHLLAASQGPKISRLAFELEAGGAHLRVNVDCESGLQKSYAIPTLETEVLQATVDAGAYPVKMSADAAEMGRLLSGFQAALEEITVVAEPPGPGKCCRFQSFFDPTRAAGDRHQTLYTQVSLDTTNHLQGYSHAGSGTLDSTFNLKDFKIMVALCSGMEAQVALHLAGPGAPAVAFPHLPAEQGRPLGYSAELVLATLEEAAAPEEAPSPPPRHPQQHPSAAGAAAARPRPRPAAAPAAGAASAGDGRGRAATPELPSSSAPGASAHGPGTQGGVEGILHLARGGGPAGSQQTVGETELGVGETDSEAGESPPPHARARRRGSGDVSIPRVLASRKRGPPREDSEPEGEEGDIIPASPPGSPLAGF